MQHHCWEIQQVLAEPGSQQHQERSAVDGGVVLIMHDTGGKLGRGFSSMSIDAINGICYDCI